MQLLIVSWRDAWFDYESASDGYRSEYPVQTVGFLVREEGGVLSLAQEVLPDGDGFRAITHVPISSIVSRVSVVSALKEGA